ncbi:EF-hand calcium-binding domain-containing protein 14 isoform X1 [Ambystoma mexicanum]|uniref:EF-hand calcium-binding domain-containing protein 14 isoform X1 n=1 Tax=Ambystoma mexicanum TaxID=8296 RepID=UPI0037E91C11
MKKRKELNALIGLAADGRRKKTKKGSGHRLLRTEPPASDSESSTEEDDEFGGLAGSRSFFCKGEYLRCCKICYPLCAFVILAACVVACVGLVWMQVALKEDLDSLKEKFRAMESNQKNSFQEIPKLNEDLLTKQKQLDTIESGDMGLKKMWVNITEMNKQIALLTSAVNHLKANIKSASDLITLPNTVEELQKSVATIGSTLNSVHHDVETLQTTVEDQKKKMESLQNDVTSHIPKENKGDVQLNLPSSTSETSLGGESLKQDIQEVHNSLDEVNATIVLYQRHNDLKLQLLETAVGNVSQRVTLLESELPAIPRLEKRDNLSSGMFENITSLEKVGSLNQTDNDTETEKAQSTKISERIIPSDSKFREKLQLINALTSKPEKDKQSEESKKVAKILATTSRPTSFPRFSPRSLAQRGTERSKLSLPGITSLQDIQELFKRSGRGSEGMLSFEDLQNLLDSKTLESKYLKEFDTNGDDNYSLSELKLALGV